MSAPLDLAQIGAAHGLPPQLLPAVMQAESGGNPRAVSPAGAEGAFQFMPGTAQQEGVNPFNPVSAAHGAARYLASLKDQFGSLPAALTAYNWGPGNVQKYGVNAAPPETHAYVGKVMAAIPQQQQLSPDAQRVLSMLGGSGASQPSAPQSAPPTASAPNLSPDAARVLAMLNGNPAPTTPTPGATPAPSPMSALPQHLHVGPINTGIPIPQAVSAGLVGAGHGAMDVVNGLHQLWNDATNPGANKALATQVQGQNALYAPLAKQSTAAKVGNVLGNIGATAPLGLLAAPLGAAGEGAGALSKIGGLLGRTTNMAGIGAAAGGAQYAPQAGDRYQNMVSGGLLGGALPLAGSALSHAASVIAPHLPIGGLADRAAMAQAGSKLREMLGGQPLDVQAPPMQGVPLTLAQASNHPALIAAQRAMATQTPFMGDVIGPSGQIVHQGFADLATRQNKTLLDGIKSLTPNEDLATSSARLDERVEALRDAAKTHEKALWDAVDPDPAHPVMIPAAPLRQALAQHLQSLDPADAAYMPSRDLNVLRSVVGEPPADPTAPDTLRLSSLKKINSALRNSASDLNRTGDSNGARLLGGLRNVTQGYMDNLDTHLPDPATAQAYQAARAFSRQVHDQFGTNPVAKLFAQDSTGADRVLPSQAAKQFLTPSAPENLDALLKVAGKDPAAMDAVRSHVANKLLGDVTLLKQGYGSDPEPFLSLNKLTKSMQANAPLVNRIFTPEQRHVLDAIVQTKGMVDRTAQSVGTGSDTVEKASTLKSIGGELLGHALHSALDAHIPGLGAASRIGGTIYRGVTGMPKDRAAQFLRDALTDGTGQTAKLLMMKPSPGNLQLMAHRLAPYLASAGAANLTRP